MHPLYTRGSNIYLLRLKGPEIISSSPRPQTPLQSNRASIITFSDQEGFQTILFLVKECANIPLNCISHRTPHLKGTSEWLLLFQWSSNTHPLSKRSVNVILSQWSFTGSPCTYGSLRYINILSFPYV